MASSDIKYFSLGDTNLQVGVNVTAHTGTRHLKCHFDETTGVITNLLPSMLWSGIRQRADVEGNDNLVRRFTFGLVFPADSGIVIAQRHGEPNRYRGIVGSNPEGELVSCGFAPCSVDFNFPSDKERAQFPKNGSPHVWTAPMRAQHSGPNRIDVWVVGMDGTIDLFCLYLVTLDNGKSFQVAMQERWSGHAARRPEPISYTLRSEDKRVHDEVKKEPEIQKMLDRYVFVPGEHSEHFESRLGILANPEFRALVEKAELRTYNGAENFWFVRKPAVELRKDQGYVKFMTYGGGRASMGIIILPTPVKVGGIERREIQFDHRAIVGDLADHQGIVFLAPGTVIDIDLNNLVNMDKEEGRGKTKQYPPKVREIIPQMIPTPLQTTAAAA